MLGFLVCGYTTNKEYVTKFINKAEEVFKSGKLEEKILYFETFKKAIREETIPMIIYSSNKDAKYDMIFDNYKNIIIDGNRENNFLTISYKAVDKNGNSYLYNIADSRHSKFVKYSTSTQNEHSMIPESLLKLGKFSGSRTATNHINEDELKDFLKALEEFFVDSKTFIISKYGIKSDENANNICKNAHEEMLKKTEKEFQENINQFGEF
jgi:hypothetical protein